MLYKGSYEDLIYILIGVAWIGYSIYKGTLKSKERKKAPSVQNKKTGGKNFLESFLDDLSATDEKPFEFIPTQPEIVVPEAETAEEKIFSYDDYYEESNLKEETGVYKPDETADKSFVRESEPVKHSGRKKKSIDLRKAIVYSEILNTRYF